jgi:hypothetical protein
MDHRLTRRGFARLAFVGSVAAGSLAVVGVPSAGTIFARSANLTLLGIGAGPIPTSSTDVPEISTTELDPAPGTAATQRVGVGLVVQAINLTTGRSQPVRAPQVLRDGTTSVLCSNESVTGCAVLGDGALVLAISPVAGSLNETEPTRLIRLTTPATAVPISGLKTNEQLGNLVATADGKLVGLVSKRNGEAPARLVSVLPLTGAISTVAGVHVPGNWRLSTLAQSPDGHLYATMLTPEGDTNLVQLGTQSGQSVAVAPLTVDGTVWNNGLQSLVFFPTGQLVALGALRYEAQNALYSVNVQTGVMRRLYDLDVNQLAVAQG